MEKTMLEKIKETAEFIRMQVDEMPKTAVILGTGLGDLVNQDRKSTRLNSSHRSRSYAVFCLKKKRETG